MILRITNINRDAYNGREFYPRDNDKGARVSVVGVITEVYTEDGEYLGHADDAKIRAAVRSAAQDEIEEEDQPRFVFNRFWVCLAVDGRKLELAEDEVELVRS